MKDDHLDAFVICQNREGENGRKKPCWAFIEDGSPVSPPRELDLDKVYRGIEDRLEKLGGAKAIDPETIASVMPRKGDGRFDVNDFLIKVGVLLLVREVPVITAVGRNEHVLAEVGHQDERHMRREMARFRSEVERGEHPDVEGTYYSAEE